MIHPPGRSYKTIGSCAKALAAVAAASFFDISSVLPPIRTENNCATHPSFVPLSIPQTLLTPKHAPEDTPLSYPTLSVPPSTRATPSRGDPLHRPTAGVEQPSPGRSSVRPRSPCGASWQVRGEAAPEPSRAAAFFLVWALRPLWLLNIGIHCHLLRRHLDPSLLSVTTIIYYI